MQKDHLVGVDGGGVQGHTPGPWFTLAGGHCVAGPMSGREPPTGGIAMCSMGVRPSAENIANALLIAAAPEMLLALRVVRMSRGWHEMTTDTQALIVDAIATATGEGV